MSKATAIRIIGTIFVLWALIACSKDAPGNTIPENDYSEEIVAGKTLYITSSQVSAREVVDVSPDKATLSIDGVNDGMGTLSISYEFVDGGARTTLSFRIPEVSLTKEGTHYTLAAQAKQGKWSVDEQLLNNVLRLYGDEDRVFDFDEVSVSGEIGFDGNASIDLSGRISGEAFGLKIQESSVTYPGSQMKVSAIIDYVDYREISISNLSSSPCDVSFRLQHFTWQQSQLHLDRGENAVLGFYYDNSFWGEECPSLEFSFQDSDTQSFSGLDIAALKEGDSIGSLKRLDDSFILYLREVKLNSLFTPFCYRVERYEIVSQ